MRDTMNRNIKIETYENDTLLFKNVTTCIREDDYLEYDTDNDHISMNLNNFSFTKENVESIMQLNKARCILKLKKLNQELEIPLEYVNYKFENNTNITIEYKLISNEFPIKINLEIGEIINEI